MITIFKSEDVMSSEESKELNEALQEILFPEGVVEVSAEEFKKPMSDMEE